MYKISDKNITNYPFLDGDIPRATKPVTMNEPETVQRTHAINSSENSAELPWDMGCIYLRSFVMSEWRYYL